MCPACGNALKVQKTSVGRLVHTLHIGAFLVRETVLLCDSCDERRTFRSEELRRIIPEKSNFGYDVIVYAGRRIFHDNRSIAEVQAELRAGNVSASDSEVEFLGRKFIAYLSVAHRRAASRLREAMKNNGGYMLHIDATCEGGGPMLLSGMDAITSTILWNRKIPTEKAEHVVPFLKEVDEMYGRPIVVVADMSAGFENAVREVFGDGMRMLICHFHFLRDVGKDLLAKDYETIRKRLRKDKASRGLRYRIGALRKVVDDNQDTLAKLEAGNPAVELADEERAVMPALAAYTIAQWTLDGKNVGDAYGFPFDRPLMSFASRVEEALRRTEQLKRLFPDDKNNTPIYKLAVTLRKIVDDKVLRRAVSNLEDKIKMFDKLRKAMRIAPESGGNGLNDDGGGEPIEKIERRVVVFRESVVKNPKTRGAGEYGKMIAQMDKYWDRLFADPVTVETPNGTISIQPQRTNNIMEQFFRGVRRAHRRRTGNNSMKTRLKAMDANAVLVKNIENKQYLEILLDGKKSLEELFSDIDIKDIREEMCRDREQEERIPPQVRRMIKRDNFPSEMVKSLKLMLN